MPAEPFQEQRYQLLSRPTQDDDWRPVGIITQGQYHGRIAAVVARPDCEII